MNHGGEVWGTVLKSDTIGVLRLTNQDFGLEGGFVYPSKEIVHTSTRDIFSITIVHEVLHLLEDLVAGNICLVVVGLEFPLVFEWAYLLLKLSSAALGEVWCKKCDLEFPECWMQRRCCRSCRTYWCRSWQGSFQQWSWFKHSIWQNQQQTWGIEGCTSLQADWHQLRSCRSDVAWLG